LLRKVGGVTAILRLTKRTAATSLFNLGKEKGGKEKERKRKGKGKRGTSLIVANWASDNQ